MLVSFEAFSQNDSTKISLEKFNTGNFEGLYFGIAGGSQNVFGGSFVDGVDVLAKDTRFVTEFSAGFRKQLFQQHFLIGLEFQLGFLNGNLKHEDEAANLEIDYENNSQKGFGLTTGYVIGEKRRHLVFLYANETSRDFDVFIRQNTSRYTQGDQQGMLKYGIGYEANLLKGLNIRAYAGRLRVDFGDQITNIEVDDKGDYMLGIVYQF